MSSASQLEEALTALTSGAVGNDVVQTVQAFLGEAAKQTDFVVNLSQLLMTHPNPAVRHLSAILLRRKITTHWTRTHESFREGFKDALLKHLTSDPELAVRRLIGHLVATVAKHAVPAGEWPQLLPFLHEAITKGSENDGRIAALDVFANMAESVSAMLADHAAHLAGLFSMALQDGDKKVRSAGLRAFGATVTSIAGDAPASTMSSFAQLMPSVIQVIGQCVSDGDDDAAIEGIEVVLDLMTLPGSAMKPHVPLVLEMAVQVTLRRDVVIETRERFMSVIETMCEYRNSDVRKTKGAIEKIISVGFELLIEPPVNETFDKPAAAPQVFEDDENIDSDEMEAYHLGSRLLASVSSELPTKRVYPLIRDAAGQCIGSGDMIKARAGLLAMGVAAEGCESLIKNDLGQFVPAAIEAGRAPSVAVREAAVACLALLSEYLIPDILIFHQQILPYLLSLLSDQSSVTRRACYALEVFCEQLDDEILPYLGELMERLFGLLLTSGDTRTREMAVSAIGSTATAVTSDFAPYFEKTMEIMLKILDVTEDELLTLRARGMECVGCIAISVGREVFEPHIPAVMEKAVKGFELEFYELREYTFGFFSNLALVLGGDIVNFLPHILPALFESIENDDVVYSSVHAKDDGAAGALLDNVDLEGKNDGGENGEGEDGGDGEDDVDEDNQMLTVRTAFLDEKATAFQTLGIVAKASGVSFVSFLNNALSYTLQGIRYFHQDVRVNAIHALQCLSEVVLGAFPGGNTDHINNPVPHAPLSTEALEFSSKVWPAVVDLIKNDDSRQVAAAAATRLAEMITMYGSSALTDQRFTKKLYEVIGKIFRRKTTAQRRGADDDDDDDHDHDGAIIDGAGDLIISLAHSLGPAFADDMGHFVPYLLKFISPSRSQPDRLAAAGTIAQAATELGPAFEPHVATCLPAVVSLLTDEDSAVRRNATFCVGTLIRGFPAHGLQFVVPTLQGIAPQFVTMSREQLREKGNKEIAASRDNAASCLARITMTLVETAPEARPFALEALMQQTTPHFFQSIPLLEDYEEEKPVYDFLVLMLSHDPALILDEFVPAALEAAARIVNEDGAAVQDKSLLEPIVAAVSTYASRNEAKIRDTLPKIGQAEAAVLRARFGWQ